MSEGGLQSGAKPAKLTRVEIGIGMIVVTFAVGESGLQIRGLRATGCEK